MRPDALVDIVVSSHSWHEAVRFKPIAMFLVLTHPLCHWEDDQSVFESRRDVGQTCDKHQFLLLVVRKFAIFRRIKGLPSS